MCPDTGQQNILTESISPKLVAFLGRLGFLPAGSNDYKLDVRVVSDYSMRVIDPIEV